MMDFFVYCFCFLPFLSNVFCDFVNDDTKAQFFTSEKGRIVQAYVGEKVQLQCQVANLADSGVAVLWTKDTLENVIVSEREVIMDNGHISMPDDDYDTENWNIDINNVEYSDAGDYFCQITTVPDRLVQKISLLVKTSPAIRIVPPGSFMPIKIGDPLNLSCISDHKLFSRIEWRKSDSILQASPEGSNVTSINYQINSVSLLNDGIYQCVAFINASQYEEVHVRVQVIYSPQLLTKDRNLAFKEGENAMLSCNFTASPPALALWYRRGQLLPIPLTSDNRMKMVYGLIFDNSSNLYYGFNILHINNTNIDDCGIYVCNVTNSVGGSVVQVNFGAAPVITSVELDKKKQRLSWTIKSVEPLLNFDLHYARVHDGLERSFSLLHYKTVGHVNRLFIYQGEANTNYFNSGSTYKIYLVAKNRYGSTASETIFYEPFKISSSSNDTVGSPISNDNSLSPIGNTPKNCAISLASKAAFVYFMAQCRLVFTRF